MKLSFDCDKNDNNVRFLRVSPVIPNCDKDSHYLKKIATEKGIVAIQIPKHAPLLNSKVKLNQHDLSLQKLFPLDVGDLIEKEIHIHLNFESTFGDKTYASVCINIANFLIGEDIPQFPFHREFHFSEVDSFFPLKIRNRREKYVKFYRGHDDYERYLNFDFPDVSFQGKIKPTKYIWVYTDDWEFAEPEPKFYRKAKIIMVSKAGELGIMIPIILYRKYWIMASNRLFEKGFLFN